MAILYRVEKNGAKVQHWDINCVPVLIGRSPVANIRVDDEGMSRRHLMILRDEDGFVVQDLNSRNGTWLKEERVSSASLQDHDRIRAGSTVFEFEDARESFLCGPHGTKVLSTAA